MILVAIAGGVQFSLAVSSNGDVYAWGDNQYGELGGTGSTNAPRQVSGISNIVWVSACPAGGNDHALAMGIAGGTNQFWGWGYNQSGQVGNGTSGNNVTTPALLSQFTSPCVACLQFGTNGTCTAYKTGTLRLYFNDDYYPDNGTSTFYSVTISNFSPVTVYASNDVGTVVGTVTNGVTYSYIATGFCSYLDGNIDNEVDASGIGHDQFPRDCAFTNEPRCGFICPSAICYSLVGRIE